MITSRYRPLESSALALALAIAQPAAAHHSFALFDSQKTQTVEGTVKDYQWTNPHIWIQLMVNNTAGHEVEWSIEGPSPNGLVRQGWTAHSLKPGDQAVIQIHPLKSGAAGGSLLSATVNGKAIGQGG